MSQARVHELIGIGVGVFNLSLAALLEDNGFRDALFFDAQPKMGWHGGMLLDSSELQVHYLKNLVTPVDPTSRFTFLNYLKERWILYQFINRKSSSISRNQFQYYFRWVADQLPTLRFDSRVQSATFDDEVFTVTVDGQAYLSRHIAIATGIAPVVPMFVEQHLGDKVFHVRDYLHRCDALNGRRIAVIGGGQSGAEVVMDVMENVAHESLYWLGRRMAFSQLEDNCFVNELYVPSFTQVFRNYPTERKREFVERMAMTSDGINQGLLDRIYRLAFERRFFSPGSRSYQFMTGQEMTGLDVTDDGLRLSMRSWVDGADLAAQRGRGRAGHGIPALGLGGVARGIGRRGRHALRRAELRSALGARDEPAHFPAERQSHVHRTGGSQPEHRRLARRDDRQPDTRQ